MTVRTMAAPMGDFVLIASLLMALSAQAAEPTRPYATGNFAQEIDGKKDGVVKKIDGTGTQTSPSTPTPSIPGAPKAPSPFPQPTMPSPQKPVLPGITATAFYIADTAQAVMSGGVVAGNVSWQCQGKKCQAKAAVVPAANLCRALALRVGIVNTFSTNGQKLDAGGLAQCNAGLTAVSPIAKPKRGFLPAPSGHDKGQQANSSATPFGSPKPQAAAAPAKSGGGFAPKSASTPASKPSPSESPAPAPRSYPITVRTGAMTVTGMGIRETGTEAARRAAFVAISLRTAPFTVTGTGTRESSTDAARRAAFVPITLRTPVMAVTGTGRRE